MSANSATGHYFFARWLVDQGRGTEAVTHLALAIERSTAYMPPRVTLMNLYAARGDQPALEALVESTLTLAPSDPAATAYFNGGTPYSDPATDGEGLWDQGLAFTNQARHLEAAVVYRQAVAAGGTTADILNNLGWSLGQLGFLDLAIPFFEQALEHRPEFSLAANNLNWAKGQLGAQ